MSGIDFQLLTPRETAERLSISERKLWQMTASRELPFLRIGRCVRFRVDDLRHWLDAKMQEERRDAE